MKTDIFAKILTGLALLALAFPVWAQKLDGNLIQGGLVIGKVDPTTSVSFQGKALRVSPAGIFVMGFDRDAPLENVLRLCYANGKVEHRNISLARRNYNIERINGLAPNLVEPKPQDLERINGEIAMVKRARQRDDPRTDFTQGFIWPVKGKITGVYGSQRILNDKPRSPHYGVDISAPIGTPVKAPADGVVSLLHPDMFFSGNTLIIDHGHGLSSSFLHLNKILVREGQGVKQGEVIAQVGATGRVTGAHLDWRMNWFDKRIDPALLVPPMPGEIAAHVN
jgi:murein DD-endopeptidase MepM/ murein hydrolase activator NlpD